MKGQTEKPAAEVDLRALKKKVSAGASYRNMIAAAEAGKPICVSSAAVPIEVMIAMDVYPVYPESLAAISAAVGKADPFFDLARDRGYTNTVCSYTRCGLGIAWSNECAFGPLPKPDIFMTDVSVCCLHVTWWAYLEDHFGKPTFYMDMPATDNPDDPEYVAYFENQIHEMVRFIETNTDCRFDEQRMLEAVTYSDLAAHHWDRMMELRKNKPSPMSFQTLAGQILPLVTFLGGEDAMNYYEGLSIQYQQDIEDGKSPCKDGEKYRLIWNGIPIWHHLQVIKEFEDKGANFVWEPYTSMSWGNKTKSGRLDLSNPFGTLAEKYTNRWGNRPIRDRVEHFDRAIREYDVDGLVMFSNRSCRPMSIGERELVDLIKERHDIPILIFEGDQADAEGFSWDDARTRIDGFIEVLGGRKR